MRKGQPYSKSKAREVVKKVKTTIVVGGFVGLSVAIFVAGRRSVNPERVIYNMEDLEPLLKVQFYAQETLNAINDILK